MTEHKHSTIEVSTSGAVGIITLNRPENRNAVNLAMAEQLSKAVDSLDGDPSIRVMILSARGPAFCAGQDLKALAAGEGEAFIGDDGWAGLTARRRRTLLIAAVDGPAVAGGFELVLASDLVVASSRASFALPEVRHGLLAAAGGAARLPRRIPPVVAREMLITGSAISADRAFALGLLNRITKPGQALAAAEILANEIVGLPAAAVDAAIQVSDESLAKGERYADQLAQKLLRDLVEDPSLVQRLTAFTTESSAPIT